MVSSSEFIKHTRGQTSNDLLLAVAIFFTAMALVMGGNPTIFFAEDMASEDRTVQSDRIAKDIANNQFSQSSTSMSSLSDLERAIEDDDIDLDRYEISDDESVSVRFETLEDESESILQDEGGNVTIGETPQRPWGSSSTMIYDQGERIEVLVQVGPEQ